MQYDIYKCLWRCVALRKESVDRNRGWTLNINGPMTVALRKESVDRNICMKEVLTWVLQSLSARRAWIEICNPWDWFFTGTLSLSARRAWIEIFCLRLMFWLFPVALRKESVDRNVSASAYYSPPPVALRKESVDRNSTYVTRLPRAQVSLSARRAWIEISAA